jgi:hypothetical protein
MKNLFKVFLIMICLVSLPLYAGASQISSSSDPSLSGATLIDFSSQPLGVFTSLSIGNVILSTSNNQVGYVTDAWGGSYNATGRSMENQNNSNSFNFLRFDFSTPVNAFGFNMGASNEDWILRAYNSSNSLLEAFTLPQTWYSNAGEFYGIANPNIAYATLTQVTSVNEPGGIDHIIMDNFKYVTGQINSVPEPATMLLLGSGLLGLLGFRRKIKK